MRCDISSAVSRLPVRVRQYSSADEKLIKDSWTQTIRFGCDAFFWMSSRAIVASLDRMIDLIQKEAPELLTVICSDSDADQVVAWGCRSDRCVHMVYVKRDFRGHGLGRLLTVGATDASVIVKPRSALDQALKYNPRALRDLVRRLKGQENGKAD